MRFALCFISKIWAERKADTKCACNQKCMADYRKEISSLRYPLLNSMFSALYFYVLLINLPPVIKYCETRENNKALLQCFRVHLFIINLLLVGFSHSTSNRKMVNFFCCLCNSEGKYNYQTQFKNTCANLNQQ